MTCCLEIALVNALRDLPCSPIRSDNHFVLERKCTDCIPYVVVKATSTQGLRTSDGVSENNSVEINAYFSADNETQAFDYQSIVKTWLNAAGCLDLGICGCFCIQTLPTSRISPSAGGMIRYSVSFSGRYHSELVGSGSV